jgi:nickel-dependent lactate racemase
MIIQFPYPEIQALELSDSCAARVLAPQALPESYPPAIEIIRRSLEAPAGSPALRELAAGKQNVLILVDDHSRHTPAHLVLPLILEELSIAGVRQEHIHFLVASGTHRAMSAAEKDKKFGPAITQNYAILDHRYDDPTALVQLPATPGGTEIWVNRLALEADLLVGTGHIVPHRVAGFSGGGKIVQPGICGTVTTGQTHWLSARFPGAEVIGKVDNPVRVEIEAVAAAVGLRFITNVVMDARGEVAWCFSGEPEAAFKLGAEKALEIFGAPLERQADLVIADSYPSDVDLWIAAKGIYAADLALRDDGALIFVSPCPEGVAPEYPGLVEFGYRSRAEIAALVQDGEINDLALAAHLVHVGEVIRRAGIAILVSPGIPDAIARQLGFTPAATPGQALELAQTVVGQRPSVVVLKNGGEIMPILRREPDAGA